MNVFDFTALVTILIFMIWIFNFYDDTIKP